MPQTEYSQAEVDAAIAAAVTQADADSAAQLAVLAGSLQTQIDALKPPITPPTESSTLKLGASDLSAFPGVTLQAHRVYYGVGTRPSPATALAAARAAAISKQRLVLSLDRGKGTPGWIAPDPAVLASYVPALTATADIRVILHHEPEDDFKKPTDGAVLSATANLTGYQGWYIDAAQQLRKLIPGQPLGPCLMAWTGRKGGSGWGYWLDAIPDALLDFVGVDGYGNPGDPSPNALLQTAYAYALKRGKPLIIAETLQEQTGDQVGWINGLVAWAQAMSKANPHSPIDTITMWPGVGPNGNYTPTTALLGALPKTLQAVSA